MQTVDEWEVYQTAFSKAYNNAKGNYGDTLDLSNLEYSVHPLDFDDIMEALTDTVGLEVDGHLKFMPYGIPVKQSNFVGPGCVVLHLAAAIVGVANLND